MEIVLAENAKMKVPVGEYGMLTQLGYANETKCKWMVDCNPRFNLLQRFGEGSNQIPETTMREIEKLSG